MSYIGVIVGFGFGFWFCFSRQHRGSLDAQKHGPIRMVSTNLFVASVTDEIVADGGPPAGTGGVPSQAGCSDPPPQQVFTSISVGFSSRVSEKLKGQIWAGECVDFGYLFFPSPQSEAKYKLSMTPSVGSSNQPQLTIEPCHNTKELRKVGFLLGGGLGPQRGGSSVKVSPKGEGHTYLCELFKGRVTHLFQNFLMRILVMLLSVFLTD